MFDDDVAFYKDALWYAIIGEKMINQTVILLWLFFSLLFIP